jgi:sugar phosphate isomerase/epimerase
VHPRLTILSTSVFKGDASPGHQLELAVRAGAARIGISRHALRGQDTNTIKRAALAAGVEITHIGHGPLLPLGDRQLFGEAQAALRDSLESALALGAGCVYGPAGGAPGVDWEAAAAAFAYGIEPTARLARECGVRLVIEPTISLFADLSLLHTLADTAELAQRTDLGVCVDVQHCWAERHLRESIRSAGGLISLVQLSDWLPGRRDHFRAVPGDGAIPLERIIGWVLEAGYSGFFDLEVYPEPGVDEVGTAARAIEAASALLERAGA